MNIHQNYPYHAMAQRPWFEDSQWLLMRWHFSATSLKSVAIYGTEDLKRIKKTLIFLLCHYSPNQIAQINLGLSFQLWILEIWNHKESIQHFSIYTENCLSGVNKYKSLVSKSWTPKFFFTCDWEIIKVSLG